MNVVRFEVFMMMKVQDMTVTSWSWR